ncbi:hypothetical protein HID58_063738 [Brassica napus]|uniref:Uncharacterized protein n=1 Tax=Brassica napus TaxID=3708 RepID=A0ABQ7Z7Y9_BRANA|nr:hypothetical protein HID58_063738 [Brassica napus]
MKIFVTYFLQEIKAKMALNISSEVFREVAEKGFFLDSSCLLPSILFVPPYTHRVATSLRMAKSGLRSDSWKWSNVYECPGY